MLDSREGKNVTSDRVQSMNVSGSIFCGYKKGANFVSFSV